ncbi:MAG: NAD(P)H-hydrate dehydratase [Verrucomicrobiae bacterium]|nr:NAD(P)H-hydrate dehydratase [Verrucomicrobiae bacterium]
MPVPVISVAQMREWEAATWAAGQTEAEVIRRVGECLARRARRLTSANDTILILAGKGHNGDDARAAREFLGDRQAMVIDLLAPDTDLPQVEKALSAKPALVIDGLFGVGLNRPLSEAWQQLIAAVNAAGLPVLAVDIPSGLNADTGETFGACIQAAVTLTVGAPKTGMLAASAWPFVGRLEVADDVGLIPCPLASELNWTLPPDFQNFPPARAAASHKGSFGHVSIIAGSLGFHGAAVLAARGAQRAQPGLVTVYTQPDVYYPVAGQLQAAMVGLWQADSKKMFADFDALLVGPGLAGPDVPAELRLALRHMWRDFPHPLIVDASALDLLPPEPFLKKYIRVLTPHPGEAARLLNWPVPRVQADRVKALREISRKFGGAWVILKGHQTLVGRVEGDIFVNPSGNPHLAQGGSGDLLGGFLTGLLAQSTLQADAFKTLRYAVWQHGAAADKLQSTRANWTVEDLAAEIGNAR